MSIGKVLLYICNKSFMCLWVITEKIHKLCISLSCFDIHVQVPGMFEKNVKDHVINQSQFTALFYMICSMYKDKVT